MNIVKIYRIKPLIIAVLDVSKYVGGNTCPHAKVCGRTAAEVREEIADLCRRLEAIQAKHA